MTVPWVTCAPDAGAFGETRQVAVYRDDAARVVDLDHVAVAALGSRVSDAAVARGPYRGADGRGVVDAFMGADQV